MALTYRGTKGSPLTIAEIDSNFAYFTGSHSITGSVIIDGSLIVSGSLLSTEAIQISGSFNPVDSEGSSLGSEEFFWGELYLGSASVNFMGSPNNQIASIKAYGENVQGASFVNGMCILLQISLADQVLVDQLLKILEDHFLLEQDHMLLEQDQLHLVDLFKQMVTIKQLLAHLTKLIAAQTLL